MITCNLYSSTSPDHLWVVDNESKVVTIESAPSHSGIFHTRNRCISTQLSCLQLVGESGENEKSIGQNDDVPYTEHHIYRDIECALLRSLQIECEESISVFNSDILNYNPHGNNSSDQHQLDVPFCQIKSTYRDGYKMYPFVPKSEPFFDDRKQDILNMS